ncbi:MAG: hypothetical protein HKO13_10225 [Sphingomonas sp.]|nr:hypothetical protein [Sphingomonas sp.]RZV51320.1 MAG: hypothetical protein EX258_03920 [Sphingomonadaceae bacterium]
MPTTLAAMIVATLAGSQPVLTDIIYGDADVAISAGRVLTHDERAWRERVDIPLNFLDREDP